MIKKIKYKSVEEIPAWQKAHELTLAVYKITKNFPKHELYGLTSQSRRSASSVAANIVEGFNKNTTKELIQFLYNARASCAEAKYHLRLASDLGYLNNKDHSPLKNGYDELGKQLNGWISSLKRKI